MQFKQGKIHSVIGASGSGKSTLLKLILGLLDPDSGSIKVGFPGPRDQGLRAQRIGYVIQEGDLFPHLSTRENICLTAEVIHWPRTKIKARLDELVNLTNFSPDLLQQWPDSLSGGQKQRASLMRALFLDPPLFLMDEPLSALDPILRSELQVELKEIFQRLKKTVVFVTHDLREAALMSDTVTLLNNGSVEQFSTVSEFFCNPKTNYVKKFIESQRLHFEALS